MPSDKADVRDARALHTLLCAELSVAAGLVLSIRPRVRSRARVVCGHLDLMERLLELHLEATELLLWPKLLARAGLDLSELDELRDQIGVLRHRAEGLQSWWRSDGDFEAAARLAGVLAKLAAVWSSYVDLEERRVLPFVSDFISDAEWREIREYTVGGLPWRRLPVILGMLEPDVPLTDRSPISRWLLQRLRTSYRKKVYRDFSDRE
ncbi:hypothetical protein GCM10029976_033320 [Kribbella albertanoniae]|uniref:Death domain-containing protein n=1 Tax=Kribbella albertanoniae TaxID=1266829 RepID=A0A4R4QIG1_9ACTN|nr:hemerythrin domain-containing protein [Kribbella albertanoniae]TDC35458.1 hypothetical protein E1261_00920 [Kribbella albertanoniae]